MSAIVIIRPAAENVRGNRVGGPTELTLVHKKLQTKRTTLENRKASQLRCTTLFVAVWLCSVEREFLLNVTTSGCVNPS